MAATSNSSKVTPNIRMKLGKLTTGATQSKALPPESPNVYLKIEAESGKRKRWKAQ